MPGIPDARRRGAPARTMLLRALLGAVVLGASTAGVLAFSYGRALTLSLALAIPAAETWLAGTAVAREEVLIPFGGRRLGADLYRPARGRGVVVLVHGLSPAGRRQPDLTRLARLLAGQGRLVLVPQLDGLAAFRLDGGEIVAIAATLDHAAGLSAPLAIAGFSFGAGPALLAAAGRPGLGLAGSFGGYADLRSVIAFITTSSGAEPYNRWKLLRLLTGFVEDERDRAALDAIAGARLANPFEDTARLEAVLGDDGGAVLALVHNRRADAVGRLLARLSPSARAALDRLSPLPVMSRLGGRALIAHGRADLSIPYTESVRLADAAGTHAVILTTFHHAGPLSPLELVRGGPLDAWRLLGLASDLLSARGP